MLLFVFCRQISLSFDCLMDKNRVCAGYWMMLIYCQKEEDKVKKRKYCFFCCHFWSSIVQCVFFLLLFVIVCLFKWPSWLSRFCMYKYLNGWRILMCESSNWCRIFRIRNNRRKKKEKKEAKFNYIVLTWSTTTHVHTCKISFNSFFFFATHRVTHRQLLANVLFFASLPHKTILVLKFSFADTWYNLIHEND